MHSHAGADVLPTKTTCTATNLLMTVSRHFEELKFQKTYAAVAAKTSIFLALVASTKTKENT